MIKLLICIFSLMPGAFAIQRSTRSENDRYTLLRDRIIIERDIKGITRQSFFHFDGYISSGLKSLVGDINQAINNSNLNSTERASEIGSILNMNANTERFVDFQIGAGIPIPEIKFKKALLYPAIFGVYNGGASLSIHNMRDGNNIRTEIYLKLEQKYGVHTLIKYLNSYFGSAAIYYMKRQDQLLSKTSAQIQSDYQLAKFGGIGEERNQESIAVDFAVGRKYSFGSIRFNLEELVIRKSARKPHYGNDPLLDLRYTGNFNKAGLVLAPFGGIHRRNHYPVHQGLYAGIMVNRENNPLKAMSLLDPEFLTLGLKAEFKVGQIGYTVKLPHQNPVDNLWVSKIQSLMVQIPF